MLKGLHVSEYFLVHKKTMISQAIIVTALMLLLGIEVNSSTCPNTCGNLSIPFPFGTSPGCILDDSFLITCNHTYNPPKAFLNSGGNIEILDISLDGLIKVSSSVASDCYDTSGAQIHSTVSELASSKFPISSTWNKFTAIGCDTYALVEGPDQESKPVVLSGTEALVERSGQEQRKQMSFGCVSWCDSTENVANGTCSGIGCCQTSIPKGVTDISVDIRSFRNHTRVTNFNPCGYAFVVEAEEFEFSTLDLKDLRNRKSVPVVLDWSVGNVSCREALKDVSSYACRAKHSECSDSSNGVGYRCSCLTGFQGNPYLVDGCQDIDECATLRPCQRICTNLEGSYSCSCPKGFKGDGKKDGKGCHSKTKIHGLTMLYIACGFVVPAVGSSWIFWKRKQKKVAKLRQNLFIRNGGQLLKNMPFGQRTVRVFTAEDLKKATDNYDETRVLYGHRQTYYGILAGEDNHSAVTIQKCEALDDCDMEIFVRNIVTLSRISHRNLLKLIGCCLETQVPLLVYEFINAKTLHDYIHGDDTLARSLPWDIRLRIAVETAGALSYMHWEAEAVAITHGHITSRSVLLGHDYSVKLHDFSTAYGVEFRGEIGYCDPEYFSPGQITREKSDVYSFGVVLAELLTGMEVIDFVEERDLARCFVSSVREDSLLDVIDPRMETEGKIDQIIQVGELAKSCLSRSSIHRPTMREVMIALENVREKNSSGSGSGSGGDSGSTIINSLNSSPVTIFNISTECSDDEI